MLIAIFLLVPLAVLPIAFCAAVARLIAQQFDFRRQRPIASAMYGGLLGLVLLPFAMVTLGTLGGSFWAAHAVLGGPLTGVVAAVTAGCVSTTAVTTTVVLMLKKITSTFDPEPGEVR